MTTDITPAVIKRDRSIVIAGLAAVIALATAFVLMEKAAPAGERLGRMGGVFFMIWGMGMLFW